MYIKTIQHSSPKALKTHNISKLDKIVVWSFFFFCFIYSLIPGTFLLMFFVVAQFYKMGKQVTFHSQC